MPARTFTERDFNERQDAQGVYRVAEGRQEPRGLVFVFEPNDRLSLPSRAELLAGDFLIEFFDYAVTRQTDAAGTVVYDEHNRFGTKVGGARRIERRQLPEPRWAFYDGLGEDLLRTIRIDRQKLLPSEGNWYGNYQLQVADRSLACLLPRVDFEVPPRHLRRAFCLSLWNRMNVWVEPAPGPRGGLIYPAGGIVRSRP